MNKEIGNVNGEADTWDSLGYAHHHLGQFEAAVDCFQHALGLYSNLGDRSGLADTLVHLGDAQQSAGDSDGAARSWRQALTILEELDHPDARQVRAKLRTLT